MTKPTRPPAAETLPAAEKPTEQQPTKGGSYLRQDDGTLVPAPKED